MNLKKVILALCTILISITITANLRAPYIHSYKPSSALNSVSGLKVLSENLRFEFSGFASGKINSVISSNYICRTYAVYNVESENIFSAEMEFISPSADSIEIKLNDATIPFHTEIISQDDDDGNWRRIVKTLYSINFTGDFRKENNRIEVVYSQPVSIYETSYGYFRKSRYSSSVTYEFWPLKEWERDINFTAEITISVPYKWGISDYITGSDINLELNGLFKDSTRKNIPFNGINSHKKGILVKKYILTDILPDFLNISINED
ncbi:MAG: hypothetical protein JW982_00555 [Spirochaetes bacterium]|nr:hypothetical protein [Spirochaetota bacterium]